jgi:hypothetical protein
LLPSGWSPFDDFERIRRPLQRRSESAEDGRATLEDLGPRQVVWAELGALRSLPVELEEARDVELELLPQLSAGGALIPRDGATLDAWAVVSVEAVPEGEGPAEGQWLATERVGGRSSWGPMVLPRLPEGLEYRIALRMGGNSSAEVRLPAPAGAELSADLVYGPGTQLLVAVKDRSNNQAVSGALLRAWPLVTGASQVGGASSKSTPGGQSAGSGAASPGTSSALEAGAGQPNASGNNQSPDSPLQADRSPDNPVGAGAQSPNSVTTHPAVLQGVAASSTVHSGKASGKHASSATANPAALVRTTDHFGAACLVGLERHVPFALEVAAPGFVAQRFEGLVGHAFDLTNAQRLDVWLEPVAALEGQVYVDGRPASEFELYWTSRARVEWRRISVTAAEDGRFRLEEAPSGGVALYASVAGRGFSSMVQSSVPATEPLRLDITAGWSGRGLVRDGQSGTPIAGAKLEWLIGDLDFPVARRIAPVLSAADGSFEVAGLHPDCLRLVVTAPGYRATRVHGIPDGAGQVDFGIAEMLPSGTLEVQVEGAAEPQTLSIRLGWGNAGQGQPFDDQGRALLALERSSDYLTLRHRDGLEDIYYIEPEAQASGRVVLAVATERSLDLVAQGDPEVLSGGVDALLKWIDRRGNSVRRSVQLVQPSASARIPGIAAERVDVEWAFGQPRRSSMASFALSDNALQQLDLPVGGESWQFLMMDQSGQPVTGVQGVIYHRQGESVTRGFDFAPSDSQGLIQATRAQSGGAYVSFLGAGGAVLPDLPIQEQDFQAGPLKVVFAPELSLDLFLTSAGAPLAGARVRAETASGNVLLGSQFSDGLGRLMRQRLGAGRYWLFVEHRDHWPLRLTVDLNSSLQRSLDLPQRVGLNVVLRADGSALANAAVTLTYLDLPEGVSLLSWPLTGLRTDGQGQLTGIPAPTGRLRVTCSEGSAEFDHAVGPEPIELNLD